MKKLIFATILTAIVFLFAAAYPTWAGDPPKPITIKEAQALAGAIRLLDKFEFGNGPLRLKLTDDLMIASTAEVTIEHTRQAIVREILKKSGAPDIKTGSPEYEDFINQITEVLNQPAQGTERLVHIKTSELKLDKNEIPITTLAALWPILELD